MVEAVAAALAEAVAVGPGGPQHHGGRGPLQLNLRKGEDQSKVLDPEYIIP